MFVKKGKHYEIEEFSKLGVQAIYATQELGDSRELRKSISYELEMRDYLDLGDKTIIYASQTHSTNIAIIENEIKDLYINTDGFVTNRKDVVLFTQYADCLPIYAYDKKNSVIGMCHAGWKGAFDGIQKELIKTMITHYGSSVEDIIIGLGIGISSSNYGVGDEFFEAYNQKYGREIAFQIFSIKDNKYHYDNVKFNKLLLSELGILEENIITSDKCTYRDEFHSYRRDREKSGRNGGFIYFK
jgi:YfiH family protein